jgi:flavin-dependent dehydrogenase
MKTDYDVVIVGAGPAGLSCAKELGNSGQSVLLVEKNKVIGPKVCAGGITIKDLLEIPTELLDNVFKKVYVHYKNKVVLVERNYDLIATIDREKLGQWQLSQLNNTKILTGVFVEKINSDNSLELSSGEKIKFKFLVGADGSLSLVRNYLSLPTEKIGICIQYILPKNLENFKLYLDNTLFGAAYIWIFPHKNYTSIGCGIDLRIMTGKKLRDNFENWLKERKIDLTGAKFEAGMLNYDYRGYKFRNIFLAGDAAGLISGLTGEGIYSAIISGRQIAREILGTTNDKNLITKWLAKKTRQEKYLFFLRKSKFFKHLLFSVFMFLIRSKKMQDKVIDLLT